MLFAHAQIAELEVLSFSRGELTTLINPLTQIVDNAIVAVHARYGLDIGNKLCVAILILTRTRHQQHTLEIDHALVPSRTLLVQTYQCWRSGFGSTYHSSGAMNSFFIFEILHGFCFCLDDDEIDAWTHFVTFGIKYITGCIFADISLQNGIQTHFLYFA